VIGADVLGAQSAMLAANTGYPTKIHDAVAGPFENTYTKIWNYLSPKSQLRHVYHRPGEAVRPQRRAKSR
jgi:hypothetical protein